MSTLNITTTLAAIALLRITVTVAATLALCVTAHKIAATSKIASSYYTPTTMLLQHL